MKKKQFKHSKKAEIINYTHQQAKIKWTIAIPIINKTRKIFKLMKKL